MPSKAPQAEAGLAAHLTQLGGQLRRRRKSLGVSATTTAKAAGLSRTTLHRIESGEPSVTIGAYANVAAALGLEVAFRAPGEEPAGPALPLSIRPADYPKLAELAWQRDPTIALSPQEALHLYERNWQHLDQDAMTEDERTLLELLVNRLGGGRPLV